MVASRTDRIDRAERLARDLDDQLTTPPADVIAALGADVYPGAKMFKSFKQARTEVRGVVSTDYIFFTTDDAKAVREFYLGKLVGAVPGNPMMEKFGAFVAKGTNTFGDSVTVTAQTRSHKTSFHFIVTKTK